jgi:hypothetical protein
VASVSLSSDGNLCCDCCTINDGLRSTGCSDSIASRIDSAGEGDSAQMTLKYLNAHCNVSADLCIDAGEQNEFRKRNYRQEVCVFWNRSD